MLECIAIKPSAVVAHAVVGPPDSEGVHVRVINHTLDIATVYNWTKIAALEPIEDIMTVALIHAATRTPLRSSEDLRQVVEECQYFCLWSVSSCLFNKYTLL